jgi:hypothetical protein
VLVLVLPLPLLRHELFSFLSRLDLGGKVGQNLARYTRYLGRPTETRVPAEYPNIPTPVLP